MKHSSSTHFSGLPLDTNTLAGQWMTFSHMANHYRKLLNVKPRVNTGQHTSHSFHNFTTMTTLPSSKSNNKMGCPKPKKADNSNSTSHKNKQKDVLYSSIPGDLNISENLSRKELPMKSNSKSGKTKKQSKQQKVQQYPEYQVVFGPSSIQSSSEAAFVSDETDSLLSNGKSPSEIQPPIGVTEKICRFLNHIHQLDLTSSKKPKRASTAQCISSPSKKSPAKKSEGRPVTLRTPSSNISTNNQIDYRLYRHSKCFLDTGEKSPRKTPAKTSIVCTNPVSPCKKRPQSLSSSVSSLNNRKQHGKKLVITVDHSDHNQHPQRHSYNYSSNNNFQGTPRPTRSKLTGSGGDVRNKTPERDCKKSGRHGKNRRRAESVISIGTVCGSDELQAEDFPLSIKDICATLESGLIGDDHDDILLNRILEDNAQLLKQKKKSSMKTKSSRQTLSSVPHATSSTRSIPRSNSMTSLVPSSSKSNTAGGNIINGTNNNKDSSRDSAYGFSSGESRITTRESTPEKKCSTSFHLLGKGGSKSKHILGDNDSAIQDKHLTAEADLHPNSSNYDIPLGRKISSKDRFRTKIDGSSSSLKSKTKATVDTKRRVSSERYITFLAELTQDIVSKGIYTNKGLKLLFKSHLEQNKELNPDKLADMVEHLRMDLGIPKDDALDKIEFGYGSVSDATSTTFFYSTAQSQEKLTTESIIFKAKMAVTPGTAALSETIDNSSLPLSTSTTPSPTTIIPTVIQKESEVGTTTTTGFSSSGGINSSNNSTTTTEEGSGDITGILNSDLDLEKNNNVEEDEEDYDEEELDLLSEAEASEVLRIAGLDDGLTKEVLGILKG